MLVRKNTMVCLPCVLLPLALAVYLKFIQPIVYRLLPQRWVDFLDTYLYPTCPIQQPSTNIVKENNTDTSSCCASEDPDCKKDK